MTSLTLYMNNFKRVIILNLIASKNGIVVMKAGEQQCYNCSSKIYAD